MTKKGNKTRRTKTPSRRTILARPLRRPVDPKTKAPTFTQLTGIREVPGQGSPKRERNKRAEKAKQRTAAKTVVTPFVKGQPSWNPKGRPPNELSIAVMLREIGQEPVLDAGIKRKRMEALLRRVYQFAMLGEQWAVQFIADRTEGRPAQIVFNQLNNQSIRGGVGVMGNGGNGTGEGDLSSLPLEELVRLAERLGVRSEDYHLPPPPVRLSPEETDIETDIETGAETNTEPDGNSEQGKEDEENEEGEDIAEPIEALAVGKRGQEKGVFSR